MLHGRRGAEQAVHQDCGGGNARLRGLRQPGAVLRDRVQAAERRAAVARAERADSGHTAQGRRGVRGARRGGGDGEAAEILMHIGLAAEGGVRAIPTGTKRVRLPRQQ